MHASTKKYLLGGLLLTLAVTLTLAALVGSGANDTGPGQVTDRRDIRDEAPPPSTAPRAPVADAAPNTTLVFAFELAQQTSLRTTEQPAPPTTGSQRVHGTMAVRSVAVAGQETVVYLQPVFASASAGADVAAVLLGQVGL